MATFTSILAWETPWTGGPGRLQSMGSQELDTTEQLNNNRSMDDHVRTQQGAAITSPEERPREKPDLQTPSSWASIFQDGEKPHFCYEIWYGSPSKLTHDVDTHRPMRVSLLSVFSEGHGSQGIKRHPTPV